MRLIELNDRAKMTHRSTYADDMYELGFADKMR